MADVMKYSDEEDEIGMRSAGPHRTESVEKWRNLIAFWILGLCNNFGYVVMLSAAHDILHSQDDNAQLQNVTANTENLYSSEETTMNSTDGLQCNPLSTGTILLADIIPAVIIKLTAPFYMQKIPYSIKVGFCVLCSFGSFLMVAFSHALWLSLLGVVFASISSGFGEITFLSLSAFFNKNVISTWSSGTGAAGVFGALSYAGLITVGVSPRNSVLIMNVVPFTLGIAYWCILERPRDEGDGIQPLLFDRQSERVILPADSHNNLTFMHKIQITKSLLKYMVPLFLVYFAEYFINQGLHELIYWNDIWLSPSAQYRWYQVDYQIGVFISRSSVNIVQFRQIWILALLQFLNLGFLLGEAYVHFIPSVWIMFAIILYEGLLGGCAYVNTFYRISKEAKPEHKEFSMGVASMADSFGIALAGAAALPTHNVLCDYWRKKTT